jgi:hypothetical protein
MWYAGVDFFFPTIDFRLKERDGLAAAVKYNISRPQQQRYSDDITFQQQQQQLDRSISIL